MPELKTMSAIKMLDELKGDVRVLISSIFDVNTIDMDDSTFDCLNGISEELMSMATDVSKITRILKKGE